MTNMTKRHGFVNDTGTDLWLDLSLKLAQVLYLSIAIFSIAIFRQERLDVFWGKAK